MRADSPVLGSYTSPSFTSTLLKRTTPASLGKGFRVSPAEKDTRDGAGTPGRREDAPSVRPGAEACAPSRGAAWALHFASQWAHPLLTPWARQCPCQRGRQLVGVRMRGLRWPLRERGGFAHAWALCRMSGVGERRPHKVLLCERF